MYKLKNTVKAEIDDMLEKPLTVSRVHTLGELIDIYKDVEYIEYMHCKEAALADKGVSNDALKHISDSIVTYSDAKATWLKNRDTVSKSAMLNALQAVMEGYRSAMHEMLEHTDTEEEKAVIKDAVLKRFVS